MEIIIKLDTKLHPRGAEVFFDGKKQGGITGLTLDMDIESIKDMRVQYATVKGVIDPHVKELVGHDVVRPDGQ